ncbi:MAG: ankyrin repeat domain-containing protein [Myxococcales bacterium]|nr:ankyrin repeat domain-containing protein [Myxococcales bacterium]
MSTAGATRASLAAILEEAAATGDHARAVELLSAGALVTPNALCHAVAAGSNEIVTALLDAGANPNAPDTRGVAPIFVAAAAGHPALPTFLADPDHTNLRAAIWPAHTPSIGHAEVTWTLLARGADPNARAAPATRATHAGVSAVMVAAAFGHTPALDVLVARGADARAVDYAGRNARDFAERFEQKAAMERLRSFTRR